MNRCDNRMISPEEYADKRERVVTSMRENGAENPSHSTSRRPIYSGIVCRRVAST